MRHGEKQISELDWSPHLAECSARVFGVGELSARHWEVIGTTREEFLRRGDTPSLATICEMCGMSGEELTQLFPNPFATVYALAGVPAAHSSDDDLTKSSGCVENELATVKTTED